MPQIAKFELPDGRIGRFEVPDGTTPEQAQAMIAAELPKIMQQKPAASTVDQIPGLMPAKREQTGDIVSSSIIRGAASLAGLPGEALSGLRAARNWAQGTQYPVPRVLPTSQDIVKGFETATGTPLYQPERSTKDKPLPVMGGGEGYIASTLEGAAAGAPFGPIGALSGGVGGFLSELLGRMTNENPIARFAGGLAGGLGTGVAATRMRPTGAVLRDVMSNVDDETARAAQRLITDAKRQGITLTGPEAIAQIRGTASEPLLNVQRVVEQSRGGGPVMSQAMAARPAQNRQAFENVLRQVGPEVADPTAIAPRVQQSAERVINEARQAGNAAARALYEAAEARAISPSQWNNLTANPAIASALARVKNNPQLGLQNEMPGSVRWLDAAKKFLDEAAQPGMSATALDRVAAASSARNAAQLRGAVDVDVPEYARARGIVERNVREVVEPLQRQPIGQLAEAQQFPAQARVLFPANPETLTPSLVRQTFTQLNRQDPTAARDLTRQFLQTRFDEITQNLLKGANEFGGAKFAAEIAGNTKQAQNLRAAVESLPNGKEAFKGFSKFLQIMEAQGKRQGGGSMTEFNRQMTEELSRGGNVAGAASTIASPGRLASIVREWYERFQYGRNSEELARLFIDPQAVNKMVALAKLNAGNPGAQAIAASIVTSNMQLQGTE